MGCCLWSVPAFVRLEKGFQRRSVEIESWGERNCAWRGSWKEGRLLLCEVKDVGGDGAEFHPKVPQTWGLVPQDPPCLPWRGRKGPF